MFKFGNESKLKLQGCHPAIIILNDNVINHTPHDYTILYGWRGKASQDELVRLGLSRTPWPNSKHNNTDGDIPLSLAFDFAPYPIDWKDTHAFAFMAGFFFATAKKLDIKIRWGGDWDMDGSTRDQTLMDWGHIELLI